MAATDSGASRLSIRELEQLLRRNPNCRNKNEALKQLKAKKGRAKQLRRNGGVSKTA